MVSCTNVTALKICGSKQAWNQNHRNIPPKNLRLATVLQIRDLEKLQNTRITPYVFSSKVLDINIQTEAGKTICQVNILQYHMFHEDSYIEIRENSATKLSQPIWCYRSKLPDIMKRKMVIWFTILVTGNSKQYATSI